MTLAAASSSAAVTPDWRLAVVLVVLVVVAVVAAVVGRLGTERELRRPPPCAPSCSWPLVSLVITAALASVWLSLAFVLLMFVVATVTSTGRIGRPARSCRGSAWPSPAGSSRCSR